MNHKEIENKLLEIEVKQSEINENFTAGILFAIFFAATALFGVIWSSQEDNQRIKRLEIIEGLEPECGEK